MFDPSEPNEEELLTARSIPLEELRIEAEKQAKEMGDPFVDINGLIRAVLSAKLYRYELHRRRESLE